MRLGIWLAMKRWRLEAYWRVVKHYMASPKGAAVPHRQLYPNDTSNYRKRNDWQKPPDHEGGYCRVSRPDVGLLRTSPFAENEKQLDLFNDAKRVTIETESGKTVNVDIVEGLHGGR